MTRLAASYIWANDSECSRTRSTAILSATGRTRCGEVVGPVGILPADLSFAQGRRWIGRSTERR
jgi:hypothetical protein